MSDKAPSAALPALIDVPLLPTYGLDEAWAALARGTCVGPLADAQLGRIVAAHRGEWILGPGANEVRAKLPGRLWKQVEHGALDEPCVGDFALFSRGPNDDVATLHATLPRRTRLVRRAAGRETRPQVLAANVDVAVVVHALGPALNPRRLERFLAVVAEGGARCVLVLTKADLDEFADESREELEALAPHVPIHVVSAVSGQGLAALRAEIGAGVTAVVLGASGAGKSTLVNGWLGSDRLATGGMTREGKGRHTTTHRELLALPGGGLVIDTPGIREIGLWEGEATTLGETFADIDALADACRFADCAHEQEPGCAVQAAVADESLDELRYEGWVKLRAEQAATTALRDEHARREKRRIIKVQTRAIREKGRNK